MKPDTSDMTPDELAVLNGQAGASDNAAAEVAAATAEDDEQAAPHAAEAAAPAAEAAPADEPAAPAEAAEKPATLPTYDVPTTDFDAKRTEFKAGKADAFTKWQAGELTDEAYQTTVSDLDDQMLALATEKARADTVKQINEQNQREATERAQKAETDVLVEIAKASKAANLVDYSDPKASKTFDALLSIAKADPDNAGKSIRDICQGVHESVLAMRGLKTTPAAAAPAGPKPARNVPPTLGAMPTAAAQPVGQALSEQLDQITDPDLMEAKWAALPLSQRTGILRDTIPTRSRH